MKKQPLFSLLVAGVMLSACGPAKKLHWQHASLPSDQWQADQRACQRTVERELGRDPRFHAGQPGMSELQDSLRLYEFGQRTQKGVAQCMRTKGYEPVK